MGEGIKQRENWDNGGGKQSLPLCLVKVRAVFFFFLSDTHPPTHTQQTVNGIKLIWLCRWYSRSQPGLWWLAKAYTVRLASSS